jgi:hypothetical protein
VKQFYAYLYLRKNGTPYYAGKGSGQRAFSTQHRVHPPKDRSHILILERSSEQEAFETEMELIRNWGRKDLGTGCLRNMTEGGDNPPNHKGKHISGRPKGIPHTEEWKNHMSAVMRGRKITWSAKLKGHKTAKLTPAQREKVSVAVKERWKTQPYSFNIIRKRNTDP